MVLLKESLYCHVLDDNSDQTVKLIDGNRMLSSIRLTDLASYQVHVQHCRVCERMCLLKTESLYTCQTRFCVSPIPRSVCPTLPDAHTGI